MDFYEEKTFKTYEKFVYVIADDRLSTSQIPMENESVIPRTESSDTREWRGREPMLYMYTTVAPKFDPFELK